jgi:hypothetical protein
MVDHILDGSSLSCCDLPTSVDLQTLPDNDKKKAIILTDIIYYPHSFINLVFMYIDIYSNCVHDAAAIGDLKKIIHGKMLCLIFYSFSQLGQFTFVLLRCNFVGSALKCNLRNNEIVSCFILFHELFGYSLVCV